MRYFNKNCGFEDGDALLVEFAKCLKKVYPNDLVSRFGEDHFAVLCRNKDLESHRRLRAMMDQYFMDHYGKHLCYNEKNKNAQGLRIQLHCGVCKVTEDLDIMTICDHARIACHHIKEDSVDEIREYDHELSDQADTESYVLNNIDKAVENHYLKVYYQPVVRAMTGKLCSQEALSRWDDPELGFLAPYRFIPILEEHKQIYKVDLYAIEQVLKDFQTKEEAGIQLIPVSINLSRYDFIGRDMVQIISDLMDRYHRQRSLLEIEITESAYADSPEDMEVQIERFHKAGFQVWMDDFGSGYSSLNLLQDTNFDLIKLDMRFMRNFGEKNELIIGAMLSMANLMGVKTLAEGVEEEEQLNFLRNAGCQRIQGYYYDCPRPLDYIIEHKDQLPIEDLSDMDFYEQVSQFNLSDPFSYSQDSLVSGLISAVPCCISVWNDETEQLLLIRANDSFRKVQHDYTKIRYDFDQIGKNDDYIYRPADLTIENIRQTISNHNWESVCYPLGEKQLTVYIHDLAKNKDGHHALVFVTIISD